MKKTDTQRKPTPKKRHTPHVKCTTKEKLILRHLLNNKGEWFNIRQFSILNKIPRPTIYDIINRLINKGLVKKNDDNNKVITPKGERFLGVESVKKHSRLECRAGQLSTHHLKYKLDLKEKINPIRLKELNPNKIEINNKLPNFTEYYLYYESHTLVFKLKSIYIHLTEIISETTDEAHFEAFTKAIGICHQIKKILKIENMILENADYARVESLLAKHLFKIDDKFRVDLGDGEFFWIDKSDTLESETNSGEYDTKLQNLLKSVKGSNSTMTDVDKARSDIDKMLVCFSKQLELNNGILKFQTNQIIPIEEKVDPFQKELRKYTG